MNDVQLAFLILKDDWITVNGTHVLVNDKGDVKGGPDIRSGSGSKTTSKTPAPKATKSSEPKVNNSDKEAAFNQLIGPVKDKDFSKFTKDFDKAVANAKHESVNHTNAKDYYRSHGENMENNTQTMLSRRGDNARGKDVKDPSIAIRVGDKNYVLDGQHRMNTNLKGGKDAPVVVLDGSFLSKYGITAEHFSGKRFNGIVKSHKEIMKSQPTTSNVHVNTPLGSEDDTIKKDFEPVDENPPLNNQIAKERRVATVAVHHGDHMLMGKRRDNGKWTVPGGHVDDGEDMRDGALRELKEETGIGDAEHIEDIDELTEVTPGLKVQPFRVKFADRPSTSMLKDPDGEIKRWQWVNVKNGLPDHIKNNMHVPLERNILFQKIGITKGDHTLELEATIEDFLGMQDLVKGMDHEISKGIADPEMAKIVAKLALSKRSDYYDEDEEAPKGLHLDLGSGAMRQPGYLGLDLFPHDHGTIVHDVSMGIPFPDASVHKICAVNSLHEMGEDPKSILSEIERVLMPGGEFVYEGPNEIQNYPDWLVQTNFESNEDQVEKDVDGPTYRQAFRRVAPDAATADDAEPRTGVAQYDELPADALLAMDAVGYYFSDATSSGRGNRAYGYPSQGALVKNDDSKPHPLLDLFEDSPIAKVFKKFFGSKKKTDNTTATSDDSEDVQIAMSALDVEKGGPGSGPHPGSGSQKETPKAHPYGNVKVVDKKPKTYGKIHFVGKSASGKTGLKNSKMVPIFKSDLKKQLVYGVVLSPDEVDAQDDWMPAEEIEKAAHHYLKTSRVVGSGHTKPTNAEVVESYIAPQDFETSEGQYGPQKITKGAWVLGVKINDKSEWQKVLNGDYTGFSVGGFGLRDPSTSATV